MAAEIHSYFHEGTDFIDFMHIFITYRVPKDKVYTSGVIFWKIHENLGCVLWGKSIWKACGPGLSDFFKDYTSLNHYVGSL